MPNDGGERLESPKIRIVNKLGIYKIISFFPQMNLFSREMTSLFLTTSSFTSPFGADVSGSECDASNDATEDTAVHGSRPSSLS